MRHTAARLRRWASGSGGAVYSMTRERIGVSSIIAANSKMSMSAIPPSAWRESRYWRKSANCSSVAQGAVASRRSAALRRSVRRWEREGRKSATRMRADRHAEHSAQEGR